MVERHQSACTPEPRYRRSDLAHRLAQGSSSELDEMVRRAAAAVRRNRVIHTGDTLLHGYWWKIAHEYGPFDHAFLPINGALVDLPFLQPPREHEAVMTPEEAVRGANARRTRDYAHPPRRTPPTTSIREDRQSDRPPPGRR